MAHNSSEKQVLESYDAAGGKFLTSFQKKALLKNLQGNLLPEYRRRLEIMLLADIGKSQTQICQTLGCSQEMARYWIAVAQSGMAHKWQEKPIGRPKTVNDEYLQKLKELVSRNPREYGYAFKSWTAQWLSKHLANEMGIEISDRHINRLLKQMGLSTKQAAEETQEKPEDTQDSSITICDLQFATESSFPWSFNLMHSSN